MHAAIGNPEVTIVEECVANCDVVLLTRNHSHKCQIGNKKSYCAPNGDEGFNSTELNSTAFSERLLQHCPNVLTGPTGPSPRDLIITYVDDAFHALEIHKVQNAVGILKNATEAPCFLAIVTEPGQLLLNDSLDALRTGNIHSAEPATSCSSEHRSLPGHKAASDASIV
jgi:hypothetical protein